MINFNFIKKAFILAGLSVFIYLIYMFFSGAYIYEHLQGTWRGVDCQNVHSFVGRTHMLNNVETGMFRIRGNMLVLCNENVYHITVRARRGYIIIDGMMFLKYT